jgi:NAD-dependent dihydropyrimidine dehydrogenase PreA subunit
MARRIIRIDGGKCDGCGLCVAACREGAVVVEKGKARLLRDDYCDGLGACLPVCPAGAISFEERDAAAYDEDAVKRNAAGGSGGGRPGSGVRALTRATPPAATGPEAPRSLLRQWPVQIRLVPPNAPYFEAADLLISADCGAYAHGDFHNAFMRGRITLIGCPKLDGEEYGEKLGEIIRRNDIRSVTAIRMEVPCCGGIENAVAAALKKSGKTLPRRVITLAADGRVLEERESGS